MLKEPLNTPERYPRMKRQQRNQSQIMLKCSLTFLNFLNVPKKQ